MNHFKNILFTASLIVTMFLVSCEKELTKNIDETVVTDEILMLETAYKYGGDSMMEYYKDGEKNETVADEEFIKKIKTVLEQSYSKQRSYLKSAGNTVGVFKDGSCGSHKLLELYMDCEDDNPKTSKVGYTGDSYATNGDVKFWICVVDGAYFQRTNKSYAVLRLTSNLVDGVSKIYRHFDNQDKNNDNYAKIDGVAYEGWYGGCYIGARNTVFDFYWYTQSNNYTEFPDLGISYYVLGSFGSKQGNIYTDDEDKNNADYCEYEEYNDKGYYNAKQVNINIPGLIDVGRNTRLYFSHAE